MYNNISHDKIMVIGSGWSVKQYRKQIIKLIRDEGFCTIGINAMTSLLYPDYHLWTNRKQFSRMGDCICPSKSIMMFGHKIPKKVIREYYKGKYISVVYSDEDSQPLELNENHIRGRFRTAGCLGIAIAHLMDAEKIFVVGMDGFTRYSRQDVKNNKKNMHCYGKGHTDDAEWNICLKKDAIVASVLDILSEKIKFNIITPTKFVKHYKEELNTINR